MTESNNEALLLNTLRLLFVEDDPDASLELAHYLKKRVSSLAVAANGREALDLCGSHTFDVILSDLRMPEMDGMTFIRHLRTSGVQTPVVIMSAFSDSETICVHERGGDEAEVPVVHLLAEVGHHDDEEDDFVEAGYGHSIKIVVGDLLDCRLAHSRFSKSRLCARVFDAVFRFLYPDYIAGKNTAFGNHRCFSLKRYEVEQLPVTMLREKEECLIQ